MVIKQGLGGEGSSRVTTKTSSPNIVNEVRKEVVKNEVNGVSGWSCSIVSDGRASEILNMFMDYVLGTAIGIDNSMFFGGTQLILGDREYPNTTYFRAGKVVGDAISIYIGGTLVAVGSVGEVGGLALDSTGVGAILGVPLSIASAAAAAYGSVVVANGTVNFYIDFKDLIDFSKSGEVSPPKGESNSTEISKSAQRQIKKLSPEAKKSFDKVMEAFESGDMRGLNEHALKGNRKGQWAVDLKGIGKGRGAGRVIYEKLSDGSVRIIEILTDHNY